MQKLLLILLLNPFVAICSQYPPATVDMALERVSEHVYYVQGASGIATCCRGPGRDESQLLEYVDHDPLMPGH